MNAHYCVGAPCMVCAIILHAEWIFMDLRDVRPYCEPNNFQFIYCAVCGIDACASCTHTTHAHSSQRVPQTRVCVCVFVLACSTLDTQYYSILRQILMCTHTYMYRAYDKRTHARTQVSCGVTLWWDGSTDLITI